MKSITIFIMMLFISYAEVGYERQIKVVDDCLYMSEPVSYNVKADIHHPYNLKRI
ncbi:MAG: hypothetical protein QM493_04070 [Sulfurovum sp.]